MGDVAQQFLRSTAISGNLKTLDASGGTASALTKASYGVSATGIRQLNPEATATTTATIPAVDGAARDMGWRMAADINAEPVLFTASSWPVSLNVTVTGTTTGPSVTFTAIAYVSGVEIGRGSSTAFTLFTSQVVTFNIAAGAVTTGANPRIQIEVYANVTLAAVSVGTWTLDFSTNHASSSVDPGVYALRALRSGTVTTTPTVAAARAIAANRAGAVTTTPTVANRKAITVAAPKAVSTTPAPAVRKAITVAAPKAVTTTPTVSTPVKAITVAAPKAVTTTPAVAAARTITGARSASVTTTPTPGFARAVISARQFAVTTTPTGRARLDIPQDALNRIPPPGGTPDWPLNAPTKTIAGVTRDSAGAILGSCTVKLIRQSDDVRVATATSHATTGAYSFTRGGDDPNSYRVLATKADVPEVHGVTDVLVPA